MTKSNEKKLSDKNIEKRRDDRISYDFPVFFYFIMGKRKPRSVLYHKGYTVNVSKIGIKLFVESFSDENRLLIEKPNQKIGLEIYLPAVFRSKPITCQGVIIWYEKLNKPKDAWTLGIELLNLDKSTSETLKSVAQTLCKISEEILDE